MLLDVNVHVTLDKLFDSYLQEYMSKKQHKGIFGAFSFVTPSELPPASLLVGHLGRNEGNWALLGPFISSKMAAGGNKRKSAEYSLFDVLLLHIT